MNIMEKAFFDMVLARTQKGCILQKPRLPLAHLLFELTISLDENELGDLRERRLPSTKRTQDGYHKAIHNKIPPFPSLKTSSYHLSPTPSSSSVFSQTISQFALLNLSLPNNIAALAPSTAG